MVDAVHAARAGLEARLLTYRQQVHRHILAMVRDAAEAEELTQDTYARALDRSEMSQCVQSYLETLPDDYRVAVLLHDVYGLSNPEIAQLLGCSVATAKIRLHRARRRLREVLDAACAFDIDERGVLVCEPAPFSARANTAR